MVKNSRLFFLASLIFSLIAAGFTFPVGQGGSTVEAGQEILLSFPDLGIGEVVSLSGPFQASELRFTFPADWDLENDATLNLDLTSNFQSLMEAFTDPAFSEGIRFQEGTLSAEINGLKIGEITLRESLVQSVSFTMPSSLLHENMQENTLALKWDSAAACANSITTEITVQLSSSLMLSYTLKENAVSIEKFPKPFFTAGDVAPYPIAVILPDDPGESDYAALLAVAAGLGKATGNNLPFEVLHFRELKSSTHKDYHFVLVGEIDFVNQVIQEKMQGREPEFPGQAITDEKGIIAYLPSPWNPGRVIMAVTGASSAALQKSSAVIAADNLPTLSGKNLVLVDGLADSTIRKQYQIDRQLSDFMPAEYLRAASFGETRIDIPFYVQGDVVVSPESYIEIYFRHSQLLNYLQSGITLTLNGARIGTIRFGDHTAENGLSRIILPPDSIQPLLNTLTLSFNITPQDICADSRSGNYWVSIYGDSYLHLPPSLDTPGQKSIPTFENLPSVFLREDSLSHLVFLIAPKDKQNWKQAAAFMSALGRFTDANVISPGARFPGGVSEIETDAVVVINRPLDQIPYAIEANSAMPLAFNDSGGLDAVFLENIQFDFSNPEAFNLLEVGYLPEKQYILIGMFSNSGTGFSGLYSSLTEMVNSRAGGRANLEFINEEGLSWRFLIEREAAPAENELETGVGWLSRFGERFGESTTLIALIALVPATIAFAYWAIRSK